MRNIEKFITQFASKAVELSEYKTYVELTTRVCFYDEPNLNGVLLPYDDSALEKAKTLINTPVQAKYVKDNDGNSNLLDHCVTIDDQGNVSFGTESVGVHTNVFIKEDTAETSSGEIKTLPCLFATEHIWTRHKNYIAAIKRLYEEGTLTCSWEISSFSYTYENSIRTLGDYIFEGVALLGSNMSPAYPSAKVLDISTENKQTELLVASALSADLIELGSQNTASGKEENIILENEEKVIIETSDEKPEEDTPAVIEDETSAVIEEVSTTTEDEIQAKDPTFASLTSWDLNDRIRKACRDKLKAWCYIWFWFPAENTVWIKGDNDESELDYNVFTYTVGEDDSVTVGDPVAQKLAVSVSSINDEIAMKNDALIAANKKIEELNSQVDALSPFKAAYEQSQAEKAEAEKTEKINSMRKDAEDSKCFSVDELEGVELSEIFNTLNVNGLKLLIAERVLEKLRKETVVSSVAENHEISTVKSDLTNDDAPIDYVKAVRNFIK